MADNVRRAAAEWEEESEVSGRERRDIAEESGDGASEAEGLVGGGANEIWMPCVPIVQSRYEVASSKSVRSDIPHSSEGNSRSSTLRNR